MSTSLTFRVDDLTDERVRALVRRHLDGMFETSPPENVFALDLGELTAPEVTFWSGWDGDEVAVIGALKTLDAETVEIKSMRVADEHLGKGAGRAMLRVIVDEARTRGVSRVLLETGGEDAFGPALRLYESEGFVVTGPFADYEPSEFSVFMSLALRES